MSLFDPATSTNTTAGPGDNEGQAVHIAPSSVEELGRVVLELLDHATLRDAGEKPRLRALLTGEEVPDGEDEAGNGEGERPERGDESTPGSGEPS